MTPDPKPTTIVLTALLFVTSGAAGLVYEILWMKQLGLLFGNSAQAAAATLAAFFAGIAAGNAFWGHRAARLARPLLTYGLLEIGVTCSAILYFALLPVYGGVYPGLFNAFIDMPVVFTATKFMLAFALFFPAAFFMGGTLPVMTQYLVRRHSTLGRYASTLYALNTVGAASGALVAGFWLPQNLGIQTSYLLAMLTTLIVGVLAIWLGRKPLAGLIEIQEASNTTAAPSRDNQHYTYNNLLGLAVLSGFGALAMQVLWIRMFAQVLHNSVYTYAAILAIFLAALAIGGAIARVLGQRNIDSRITLPLLLTTAGLLVAASPSFFMMLTSGGAYIGGDADFTGYMLKIITITLASIGPATIVLGIILPYAFKLAEGVGLGPGATIGRLVSANTVAAIAGSIAAGFVLLGWLGLWTSIELVATLYVAAALWLTVNQPAPLLAVKLVPIVSVLLLVTVLDAGRLPLVRVDPVNKQETLLKVWEGADATVAVVRRNEHLRTKLNNWYSLGSTGDMTTQRVQTHLPMLLHPYPQKVFFLGLGTGITAGTALGYPVDQVVVTEIAPSVIRASEEFFSEHTNGLFKDPRVRMVPEDGRNALRGTSDKFDLIISDLFVPWKVGTGSLYSLEHYKVAHQRLREDGLYVQWLPMYQLHQEEFSIIAKTMLQAFPQVTLWRGNFWSDRAVMALIGHQNAAPLSADTQFMQTSTFALMEHVQDGGDRLPLLAHFAGSLEADDPRLASAPANTDDRPIIEYLAPINHRREKAGLTQWFLDDQLFEFLATNVATDRLATDAYLQQLDPIWHFTVQAGYFLHMSHLLEAREVPEAARAKATFNQLLKATAEGL